MEELRAVTQTHVAHAQDLCLNRRVHAGFVKSERAHMRQIAPHIIDVRTHSKPVQHIKTQTAIDLADISIACIGLGIMVISAGGGITQLYVIAHGTVRQQTHRHRDPTLEQRKLHRHIFEVTVGFILLSSGILIPAPVCAGSDIKHKGQGIARGIGSRL